jgi:hypothetical protein
MAKDKVEAVVEETTAPSTENVEVKVKVEEKEVEKLIFKSTDGNKYEILTPKILFKGQRLESSKAVTENKDVLEHLVGLNSRILKKV